MKQENLSGMLDQLDSIGMNCLKVSKELGVVPTTIYRIRNGETTDPAYSIAIGIIQLHKKHGRKIRAKEAACER